METEKQQQSMNEAQRKVALNLLMTQAQVHTDSDAALCGVVETLNQLDDGRLAATRLACI